MHSLAALLKQRNHLRLQGDQLIATSGYTYERETQYQSVQVRSGERVVRLTARGEVRILSLATAVLTPQHLGMPGRALLLPNRICINAALLRAQAADMLHMRFEERHVIDATSPPSPQDFSVIMAAIRSHPSQREVRLELQRC